MKYNLVAVLVILFILFHNGNSERILFFFAISTYSHRILVWPLVEELSQRGHEITFFSSSPNRGNPIPNVTDFIPSEVTKFYGKDDSEGVMNTNLLHSRFEGNLQQKWREMPLFGQIMCEIILKSPDTKVWAESVTFDLIIIDSIVNDCAFAFVHKYKAKHILFGTTTILPWNYGHNGLVPETSWIPDSISNLPGAENMSFLHRIWSTLVHLGWHLHRHYVHLPRIEEIIRSELGLQDMEQISELQKKISIFFTNTHFSEEYARALPPFVIPVGGLHIRENQTLEPLSKNIMEFLSKDFIYISFGSDTRISTLRKDKLAALFTGLQSSGLRCIWKWDNDEVPENLPTNIRLVKWLPQQSILAHPNISMHEAIYYKVPMIVFPIFAEQDFNAERIHRRQIGIRLEITEFTQRDLESAVSLILEQPGYRKNIEKVSRSFSDRLNSPLNTAIWYTEYVLRHNDTELMKPYTIHQTWYERRLLDVWIFLGVFLFLTVLFLKLVIVKFLSILCNKSAYKVKRS